MTPQLKFNRNVIVFMFAQSVINAVLLIRVFLLSALLVLVSCESREVTIETKCGSVTVKTDAKRRDDHVGEVSVQIGGEVIIPVLIPMPIVPPTAEKMP